MDDPFDAGLLSSQHLESHFHPRWNPSRFLSAESDSSFFSAAAPPPSLDDESVDGAGALDFDAESILDLALKAWRPPRHLRWHYRSQHSSLIAFSNAKFYDNQLIVFPGPNESAGELGVHFHYVNSGTYTGGENPVEATRL